MQVNSCVKKRVGGEKPEGFSRYRSGRLKRPDLYQLLLSKKQPHRHTRQIKILAKLVLQVILIRLFDIIGEIAEESK